MYYIKPKTRIKEKRFDESMTCVSEQFAKFLGDDLPEGLVLTDNGFYDLEQKNVSGVGIWIGFQHSTSARDRKLRQVMKTFVYREGYRLFKEFIRKNNLGSDDVIINDFVNSTDMFRLYTQN